MAETILFSSDPLRTNLDSTSVPMNADFQFELGVFATDFEPTPANTSEWLENWQPAASTRYNVPNRRFAGQFTVNTNPGPFTVGAKGWVFGRKNGAEWILFRAPAWTWPAPNPTNPFPKQWNAASATEVVLGQVNASGSPFLMKSAAVPLAWAEWQATELAGEILNGPDDDPDRDGIANIFEFIFGLSPTDPGPRPDLRPGRVEIDGLEYLQLSVPRLKDRPADLTVEVSGDLIEWDSGDAHTVIVTDSAEVLVVRDLTPAGPGKRFMRLRAGLPAP